MSNIDYPIDRFCEVVHGKFLQKGSTASVSHISIDSRKFDVRGGSAFFAIQGKHEDGHEFIANLYDRGVRVFVVSEKVDCTHWPDATVIKVSNSIVALQNLATDHRENFDMEMISITGSNGKTMVKEWLYQLLYTDFNIVRSPRSYNSQIGVPLSLLLMEKSHNLAIIEAGISEPGEMEKLEKMIRPDIGIITNVGTAHSQNFKSKAAHIDEKLKLFDHVNALIFCKDHRALAEQISRKRWNKRPRLLTWSYSGPANLTIRDIEREIDQTKIHAEYEEKARSITIPFTSDASIENCMHLWLLLLIKKIPDNAISERFALLSPVAMRLEQVEGINDCVLIIDAYNSDINALRIAVDYLKFQKKNEKYTVILSDILQSGEDEDALYRQVANMLLIRKIDRFIGIGRGLKSHAALFDNMESAFYESTNTFLKTIDRNTFSEENILLKGARNFEFEHLAEFLQKQSHETVLEIDLSKMVRNLNVIRSKLRPETKIMVMVKAFAYGSGSYDMAQILEYNRVDYLAVAYADEGISLRKDGIRLPILVLNPEVSGYDAMIRYKLEPQIFSFRTLRLFQKALIYSGESAPYPVHIKLNTGMNRLGFNPEEIEELAKELNVAPLLSVESVFAHLAGSDSPEFDSLTMRQIAEYRAAAKKLSELLDKKFFNHILNSAGILRFPEAQMDMVRLGISLYGLTTYPLSRNELEPISSLKTTIAQIREVEPGQGVGYTPKSTVKRKTKVAVLSIGYADGLPRVLGNGVGKVWVSNQAAPFIGNICMDMSMVDVSGIDCREGDIVEIFGDHLDIYETAEHLKTIPYEVITNISRRVKRVFVQD